MLFQRLGRKAGIEKGVHAHGLRHTHAAELRTERIDLGIISKQLGHRSLATTAIYVDHIAPADVIDAVRSRSHRKTRRSEESEENGLDDDARPSHSRDWRA